MSYYDSDIDQERLEASDAALSDWVSILGQLPQPASASTLDGDCALWRELSAGNDGRIAQSCPAKHFAQTCASAEF